MLGIGKYRFTNSVGAAERPAGGRGHADQPGPAWLCAQEWRVGERRVLLVRRMRATDRVTRSCVRAMIYPPVSTCELAGNPPPYPAFNKRYPGIVTAARLLVENSTMRHSSKTIWVEQRRRRSSCYRCSISINRHC